MKKYKLKKDTLTTKAGAIFTRVDGSLGDIIAGPRDAGGDISIEVSDLADFDEWFEEVKEFEEWKLEEGERYKYLDIFGEIDIDEFVGSLSLDEFRCSIGNAYPLDTPNEVIIKEQKLIPQAMYRLRMAAKKAWFEFNGSEVLDWANLEQDKFTIVYERWRSTFNVLGVISVQDLGQVYFPTEKSAEAYIDNNLDELKLLFGVE